MANGDGGVTTVITLRPYQQDAVNAFFEFVANGGRSGVIAAPTGSGKSIILSEICRQMVTQWHNTRIIICTHRYELIRQDADEFKKLCPGVSTGIYSAGLNRRETDRRVTFAGIQSVTKRAFEFGKIDLLIIDEAHLVNHEEGTQYHRFISDLRIANPNIVILGLSATPYRLDNGLLYEGEGRLFDELIYDISLKRLIDGGYLCPVISKGGIAKIDLTNVTKTAGDYNMKSLEEAADREELVRQAVDEIVKYGVDRRSWLVFAAGVNHGKHIRDEIRSRGITCELVTGEMNKKDRARTLKEFEHRKIRCLVNVKILVEGFNVPCIDLIALMVATQSTAKYVQAVGRGTRVCEGKENCLLLDFGGNVERHGVLDEVVPSAARRKGNGDAPARECLECHTLCHVSVRTCPECGYEFPPPKPPHAGNSYDGAVLSDQEGAMWIEVSEVGYVRWPGKNGKPDTIRCDFYTYKRQYPYSMWLALDHGGYAAYRAKQYVRACGGTATTVNEALQEQFEWRDPVRIQVAKDPKNKQYWRIIAFEFADNVQETLPTVDKK